jgi:hypothetical protein
VIERIERDEARGERARRYLRIGHKEVRSSRATTTSTRFARI